LLHPEAFLQRHPDVSSVKNVIILMFVSHVGILSTCIGLPIPLRLTTHPKRLTARSLTVKVLKNQVNLLKVNKFNEETYEIKAACNGDLSQPV